MRPKPGTTQLLLLYTLVLLVQPGCGTSHSNDDFISVREPLVALKHVRVIDGTGGRAKEDQTIIIDHSRITAVGNTESIPVPPNAHAIDFSGHTVIPGLVGMHEHLFYAVDRGDRYVTAEQSFARLYLASGVTSIRTAGTISLGKDLEAKRLIDEGKEPGPKIHITSPYIHAQGTTANPQAVAREIDAWADQGVTSFKIYTDVGRLELAAAVDAAHKRGLKVTGHLCAVGFSEAASLGIDNLEHGLAVDTEFYSRKRPDVCPEQNANIAELVNIDVGSEPIQKMIQDLVSHHVAITSTLPVFESFTGRPGSLDPRTLDVLAPEAYDSYRSVGADYGHAYHGKAPRAMMWNAMLKKEMEFELDFARAGGVLMAGVDPTGWGGVVAGFGDQRGVELLVEAGFTPEEAIRIASANGAEFLGESERVGTLTVGKQADLVVIRGDLSTKIADIRNVVVVFKDGVGYDSQKLIASVRGTVGRTETNWKIVIAWIVILGSVSFLVMRRLRRRRQFSNI